MHNLSVGAVHDTMEVCAVLLDIILAAGIGLTQLISTWYGIHVSVREHRIRNAVVIGIVGAIGMGLVIYSTVRSGAAQQALQGQLDAIQHNTEQPPTVTVNIPKPPPPTVIVSPPASVERGLVQIDKIELDHRLLAHEPFHINIFLKNKGSAAVTGFYRVFVFIPVAISGSEDEDADKKVHAKLVEMANAAHRKERSGEGPMELAAGETIWNTMSVNLTQEQVNDFLGWKMRLYIYVWATWKGAATNIDRCLWIQPPSNPLEIPKETVLHLCS
jgi:hypothetical protein